MKASWVRLTKQGVEVSSFLELPTGRVLVHLHPGRPKTWVVSCRELGVDSAPLETLVDEPLEKAEKAANKALDYHLDTIRTFMWRAWPIEKDED